MENPGKDRSRQQQETLQYFRDFARDWWQKAHGEIPDRINVTAQRNAAAMLVMRRMGSVSRFLDIGCGSGELVFLMAAAGVEAVGIDFSPELIKICEEQRISRGIAGASFTLQSIFDYPPPPEPFDLVAALGFIEYISPGELGQLLDKSARLLRPGGHLVVGSRNRLFNICSFNQFTLMELELGTIDCLLREAVALVSSPAKEQAVIAARDVAQDLPQPQSHPDTGIKVQTRHQYTPGELAGILARHGFVASDLYPIHYHAVPPVAKESYAQLYLLAAHALNAAGSEDHRLIPFSSSFVLGAMRR